MLLQRAFGARNSALLALVASVVFVLINLFGKAVLLAVDLGLLPRSERTTVTSSQVALLGLQFGFFLLQVGGYTSGQRPTFQSFTNPLLLLTVASIDFIGGPWLHLSVMHLVIDLIAKLVQLR